MSGAHWFILVVFGGLLLICFVSWRIDMRRFDREDEEIRRWIHRKTGK